MKKLFLILLLFLMNSCIDKSQIMPTGGTFFVGKRYVYEEQQKRNQDELYLNTNGN